MKNEIKKIFHYDINNPKILFWFVTLVSLFFYLITCAHHLSWMHDGADGGDFAHCVWILGIPHPTGYPLYILTGYIFTHFIFPFGEVAFRLNVFSAIFAALGTGFVALTLREASNFLYPDSKPSMGKIWIPMIAGFSVAFTYSYWSQALITEVYSMNAFFLGLIMWKMTCLINADTVEVRDRHFIHAAIFAGLGFTNHLATLYPFLAAFITIAALGYFPRINIFLKGTGYFILCLSLYAYLPIRSKMDPFMDWGDPETWYNFVWVLSGKQFKKLVFSSLFVQVLHRLYQQINIVLQISAPGVIMAATGISWMILVRNRKRMAFFIFLVSVSTLNFFHIGNYLVIDPLSFMLPAFIVAGIFSAIGTGFILVESCKYLDKLKDTNRAAQGRVIYRFAKLIAWTVPLTMLVLHYGIVDLSQESRGYDYAKRSFENVEPGSVICEFFYGRGLTLKYYYYVEGMGQEKNITPVYIEHLQFWWGKDVFKEHHPDLEISPDRSIYTSDGVAYDFIEKNFDRVPALYFGRMFDPPDGYAFEPVGDLYKVIRE